MVNPATSGLCPDLVLVGHYHNVRAADMLLEHRHADLMEICYLARGRQVYRVGGKDHALRAGEIFLTYPGEQHSTGGQPQERGELFWIQLRLPRRGPFLHQPQRVARPLLRRLRAIAPRHFAASPEFALQMEQLFAAASSDAEDLRRIELASTTTVLLLELLRCASAGAVHSRVNTDMNRALAHIAAHIEEPLSVDDVAAALDLSPSWFKAKFRRAIGMPPAEYILRARITRAAELLRAGHSVTATAHRLAFSSSQYFATVFKRYTGQIPSGARSQL